MTTRKTRRVTGERVAYTLARTAHHIRNGVERNQVAPVDPLLRTKNETDGQRWRRGTGETFL